MAIIRKRSHAILRSENGEETIYIVNYNPHHIKQYLETIYELKDFEYEDEEDECDCDCDEVREQDERNQMAAEDHDASPPMELPAEQLVVKNTTNEKLYLAASIGSLLGIYTLIFFMWLGSIHRNVGGFSRGDEL